MFFLLYVAMAYVFPGEAFPALAPYRIPFWLGMAGLGFSALWLAFKRDAPVRTLQLWFLLAFTLVLAVSRVVGEQWFGSLVPTMNTFGPSVAMFVLTLCGVDSLKKLRITAVTLVLLTLALVGQGVAAYHFGYKANMFILDPLNKDQNVVPLANDSDVPSDAVTADVQDNQGFGAPPPEVDEDDGSTAVRIRGLGMLNDPNDLAMAFVAALPLLWMGWRSRATMRNLLFIALPTGAILYGLFLTRSRGGVLAFVVIVCLALARKVGRVVAILVFAVLLTGGVAANLASGRQLSLSDESTTGRLDAWSEGLQMLKGQPLLGVGYGQFLDHHDLTAHNSWVLCFAETGLLGYFFWLGLLLVTYVQIHALTNHPGQQPIDIQIRNTAAGFEHALVGFMTAAFFLSRTFVPMLYLLVGLCVTMVLVARQHKIRIWSPSLVSLGGMLVASEVASIVLIYTFVKVYNAVRL